MPDVNPIEHRPKGSKISWVKHENLTDLLPYGSIILACSIISIALLSNILERGLLKKIYGKLYTDLEKGDERRRRSFTYYHVGAMMLLLLFATGCYPILTFLVGPTASFNTPIGGRSSQVTIGDVMFLFAELYSAYYLYEMCFRTQHASMLSIAHHIGLLLITQTAIALFGKSHGHVEATIEFFMCMVWGAFDVVVELPIFVMMILWRVKNKNTYFLSRIGYICCGWMLTGACTEVAVTIYLLNRSWDYWGKVFRVLTPCVFSLWILTQLYAAWRFFQMGRSKDIEYKKGMKNRDEQESQVIAETVEGKTSEDSKDDKENKVKVDSV